MEYAKTIWGDGWIMGTRDTPSFRAHRRGSGTLSSKCMDIQRIRHFFWDYAVMIICMGKRL
jgi:hypothetical protein